MSLCGLHSMAEFIEIVTIANNLDVVYFRLKEKCKYTKK